MVEMSFGELARKAARVLPRKESARLKTPDPEAIGEHHRNQMTDVMRALEQERAKHGTISITIPGGNLNHHDPTKDVVVYTEPVPHEDGRPEYVLATRNGYYKAPAHDEITGLIKGVLYNEKHARRKDPSKRGIVPHAMLSDVVRHVSPGHSKSFGLINVIHEGSRIQFQVPKLSGVRRVLPSLIAHKLGTSEADTHMILRAREASMQAAQQTAASPIGKLRPQRAH